MTPPDGLILEFLAESNENLDRLDQDFVLLERERIGPEAAERVKRIFRAIHTVKGTCGFFALAKLQAVTHAGESVLSKMREGTLAVTPEVVTGLLAMVDGTRRILKSLETTGVEGDEDYAPLIAATNALADAPAAGVVLAAAVPSPAVDPADYPAEPVHADAPAANGLRVDVHLLDRLMNLVGELVLARNQILQFSPKDASDLAGPTQRLNLITGELQESVMKTRMQPIDTVWNRFPRVVRDLARQCGKQVRVEMEGRQTELDKTILEAIKDPLTHVVRNSVDHGIELPQARVATGKPAEGKLSMRACHEGGQVILEIADDGGGIRVERVKAKAVEKGLVTAEQAQRMGDREAVNLIFLPGFSTAEQVTNVSGRGVGMDVVKTNIEKIGGTVDVQTVAGRGTTLRIKIPLTLAIVPALVVTSGGERFAIPQVNLIELVRLDPEQDRGRVEHVHGTPVYRLRGRLLPLIDLGRLLRPGMPAGGAAGEATHIVVVQCDGRTFGLVVDAICDTEEIVVKPLGALFKGISLYAGATIMGDGRVALILDVPGLARRAGMGHADKSHATDAAADAGDDGQTLVVLQAAGGRQFAMPLARVARLEEFDPATFERAGDGRVIQYRGAILPVACLGAWGGRPRADDGEPVQAIVVTRGDTHAALLADRVLDIVRAKPVLHPAGARPGVLGTAVLDGRVTELLDVDALLDELFPPAPAAVFRVRAA